MDLIAHERSVWLCRLATSSHQQQRTDPEQWTELTNNTVKAWFHIH